MFDNTNTKSRKKVKGVFDHRVLCSYIRRKKLLRKDVAGYLGINTNTLINKLKGRNYFTTEEVAKLCELLGIEKSSIGDVFFTKK